MHDSHDEEKIQEYLNRFKRYCQSPEIDLRNLVGSTALETLPLVAASPKDVATVLELVSTVAGDPEVDVRCSVLEYIVHIALMLSDPNKSCETLRSFITSHVLPIIVAALLDTDIKVVKLADCSVIVLLEHCLVPNGYVQERIWPAIIKKMYDQPLTESIIRVITLMSKMVPWVGCDTTETLFVPLFVQLCSYPEFVPRKACVSIIGDFCAVVSLDIVESKLVPSFLALCCDTVWVVRKACAEVFTSVSSAASTYTRKHHLTPAFATLLIDPRCYVRSAAFESLGPFITTFAEPSITNLGYNHNGKLVLRHPDGFEFQLNANIELTVTERLHLTGEYIVPTYHPEFPEDFPEDFPEYDSDMLPIYTSETDSPASDNRIRTESTELPQVESKCDMFYDYEAGRDTSTDFDKAHHDTCADSDIKEEVFTLEPVEDSQQDTAIESNSDQGSRTLDDNKSEAFDDKKSEALDENKSERETKDSNNEVDNPPDMTEQDKSHFDCGGVKRDAETEEGEEKKDKDKVYDCGLEEKDFNGFLFWRDPIPDIVIDLNAERPRDPLIRNFSHMKRRGVKKNYKLRSIVRHHEDILCRPPKPPELSSTSAKDPSSSLIIACFQKIKTADDVSKLHYLGDGRDRVVPDELISHFVSMSLPGQGKMQGELAHYCAYSLPAVALTLGPDNWALIKQACDALAIDQQWRVRKIVASSIHELAVIVGSDVATEDLVPVFAGFIKDLDEVRIGALKHLANFLKLLKPGGRNCFLPRLAEFLITDYEWNWRFRAELAKQLLQIVRLFTPQDISVHIAPVVFTLLQDKVAYVRNIALQLVVEVISVLAKDGVLVRSAVAELAEQFAHSSKWSRRQVFAHLCSELVVEKALPIEMFARDILPHLLDLSWDKVPNVRLSVANTLSRHIMAIDTFSNVLSPHHEVVMIVLKRLQGDKDRDVRYFATLPPVVSSETDISPTPAQLPESSTVVDSNKVAKAQEDAPR